MRYGLAQDIDNMKNNKTAKFWVAKHYPTLLQYINDYMVRNDSYTFLEAFESVDSVIYSEWRDSQQKSAKLLKNIFNRDNNTKWIIINPSIGTSWKEMDEWLADCKSRTFWDREGAVFESEKEAIMFKLKFG